MEPTQFFSLLGGVVVLFGLLKAHRFVVKEHLLPEIEPDEDFEE